MVVYEIEEITAKLNPQILRSKLYFSAMSLALGALANIQPEWLRMIIIPIWYPRYAGLNTRYCFPKTPKQCQCFTNVIREDILYLLDMIDKTGSENLTSIPDVSRL
jgi:hypothetical protein